jgi:RNA polymerase sigma-70 factor (ECF subfamily)
MSKSDSTQQIALVQGLFVQHIPALRGFLLSLLSDFTLVDDVVQETFLTVNAKAQQFQKGSNFRAWTWTIARFKALQALEKTTPIAERFAPEVIEALCAHESSEDWFSEQQMRHLSGCILELAPKAREVVELRYLQSHRPPEIARRIGWSVDSVHVALSRARIFLRDCVLQKIDLEAHRR